MCIMWTWNDQREGQFHIISIQKRLADHAFSNARTWPEIQQVHQTWWHMYNQEHHFAHRDRQDVRHSPEAVLRGMLGRIIPEEVLSRALYATQFTRQIDRFTCRPISGRSPLSRMLKTRCFKKAIGVMKENDVHELTRLMRLFLKNRLSLVGCTPHSGICMQKQNTVR
jgi:hypothetical protein